MTAPGHCFYQIGCIHMADEPLTRGEQIILHEMQGLRVEFRDLAKSLSNSDSEIAVHTVKIADIQRRVGDVEGVAAEVDELQQRVAVIENNVVTPKERNETLLKWAAAIAALFGGGALGAHIEAWFMRLFGTSTHGGHP